MSERARFLGPLACVALALVVAGLDHQVSGASAQSKPIDGRQLFVTGCSGCHGLDGAGLVAPDGSRRGPDLRQAGEAGAYFYLSTGRMPMANPSQQPVRKDPAYSPAQIDALVTYVASLGTGPAIPHVDPTQGNLADGGELYRGQCASCHSATGSGGALSYGRAAPSLHEATPTQVAAAVRIGPGQMPVFGTDALSERDLDGLVRYVAYLQHPDNRGGLSLGGFGPVPEGFLVWVLGIGGLLVVCGWIGYRAHDRSTT